MEALEEHGKKVAVDAHQQEFMLKCRNRHDNKYPGCCCDVWSMLYSYSFAQNSDWTREYPGQEEILAYLTKTAQDYNIYQRLDWNAPSTESEENDENNILDSTRWSVRRKA